MKRWLYDILKDGTIVDNQIYCTDAGVINNHRFSESIILNFKDKYRSQIRHEEQKIWKFLNATNRNIARIIEAKKK